MFVHYERELELFQEWPHFSDRKCGYFFRL